MTKLVMHMKHYSKLVNRKNAFEQYIMNAIENENFANAKELIQEEPN